MSISPLDNATGILQAAREGERDLVVLIEVARAAERRYRNTVYNAALIYLVAWADCVRHLNTTFMKQWRQSLSVEERTRLADRQKGFNRLWAGIRPTLTKVIRNVTGGHRGQQFIESLQDSATIRTGPEVRELYVLAGDLVDALNRFPFWSCCARGEGTSVIVMSGGFDGAWRREDSSVDGWNLRHLSAFPLVAGRVTRREFASIEEARHWAQNYRPPAVADGG